MSIEVTTHQELCARAVRWLSGTCGCNAVLSEMSSASAETPDAIGWRCKSSVLVECKASRADFMADRKKHFRVNPSNGMGRKRYFMVRDGLVTADELPDGWGLLHVNERRVKVVRESEWFQEYAHGEEIALLVSALRRTECRIDKPLNDWLKWNADGSPIARQFPKRPSPYEKREIEAQFARNREWLLSQISSPAASMPQDATETDAARNKK